MGAFVADGVLVSNCKYGAEYSERVGAGSRTPKEADEDKMFTDDDEEADVESRGQFGYGT